MKLAQPGEPVRPLPNSNVRTLFWTADGRYLLGGGFNTLRLWNLAGDVRTRVVESGSRYGEPPLALSMQGKALCVRSSRSASLYALPSLSQLSRSCE
ncbi:hypothetical protein GO986_03360 [Deinococcus sp. HMF7620]|uniref:Uncharacterized protein n=1 Tax=Deinococcus arboris TaxID=2682977 RepID=A0A7C9LJD0_9DEIO|nr:hypothetical protein [Deinococcus arboris]MVN85798.1 hypothetical protein [Deinococcus arboris]